MNTGSRAGTGRQDARLWHVECIVVHAAELLMDRCRREAEYLPEPRVLDYLEHRNDDAPRAWRQRQFEYQRSRTDNSLRRVS